jgi:CubicO group peptidase (beta-lactamase class C family)
MVRKNRLFTLLLLAALILSACQPIQPVTPAQAPAAAAPALDEATAAQIDRLVAEMMARNQVPGFALAVVKDGELAYAKGFGVTNLDGGAPVTSQTVFQWAENTMALTAMAAMQLAEDGTIPQDSPSNDIVPYFEAQGKLDLNARVIDYVPYFRMQDERYRDITVEQLLTHSSGIPDSGDTMADWATFLPEYDAGALERWIRNDLAGTGLLFAPGSGFEYSDQGYALLGAVIAAASGQPYEEYMAQHILGPLGMDRSTFLLEEVDRALLANPHVANGAGEVVVSEAMSYHRPFAATNNLFANVEDMAKLAQASLNGGARQGRPILSQRAFTEMWHAHSPTPYADMLFGRNHPSALMLDWGCGWFLGDVAGHAAPNTFGMEQGYHAGMVMVPDASLAVIAVGNEGVAEEFYASDTATDVLALLLQS